MIDLHQKKNATVVLVTHESDVAEKTERTLVMGDGKIIEDSMPTAP
jgi:ABC-type lipoprotein export system ATPase subunit